MNEGCTKRYSPIVFINSVLGAGIQAKCGETFCKKNRSDIRKMNQMIMDLPVIALRGLSILPNMIVHFEVSRNKSKRAIEAAMLKDQNIFLLTQKMV